MPSDLYGSNVLGSQSGKRTLPFKQSMNRGGGPSKRTLFGPPTPYGQSGGQQYRPVNTPLDSQTNATGVFSANELGESIFGPQAQPSGYGRSSGPHVPYGPNPYGERGRILPPPAAQQDPATAAPPDLNWMGNMGLDQTGRQGFPGLPLGYQANSSMLGNVQRALDRDVQRVRSAEQQYHSSPLVDLVNEGRVGSYQFQGSPMPGAGQGYAMPGVEGRAARHEARVRQGLDQGLSYEQAHRAAANTGQLEIHNDAMNYRNFQRDRMPGQMRTNAYRGIGDQGGQNADLASNLFGNIDANNAQQIEGYLGGGLDTPILDRDPVTGMMSPSQSGITKGDLMGSRGRFYAEQEADREAARQQVGASIAAAKDRVRRSGGEMPLYGARRASFTGRSGPTYDSPPDAEGFETLGVPSDSTVSYNPQTNTWTVAGGPEARARAEQQRADRQATLDRRRLEIGEAMGLDGPANSMDVKIYNRRKRSDILKQRNRAKFLARNPGRKYPGSTGAADSELTEAQQESQALSELMTQDFENLLGADNADPEGIGENFVARLESLEGTLDNKDYERMLKWGRARGLVPKDYITPEQTRQEHRRRNEIIRKTNETLAKKNKRERARNYGKTEGELDEDLSSTGF